MIQYGGLGRGKDVGNWDKREDVENDKTMTECARSAMMLEGKIPKYFNILQGVAHYHPIYSRYILNT